MARNRVVYIAETRDQAVGFRKLLAGYGISGDVVDEPARHDPPASYSIAVPEDDYEFAYELSIGFDRQLGIETSLETDAALSDDSSDEWPTCRRCKEPRTAVCLVCGNRGRGWVLADSVHAGYDDSSESEQEEAYRDRHGDSLLLICPTCDSPVPARFERRCHRCQHRFRDGIPSDVSRRRLRLPDRKGLFVIGLFALLAYVLWVFLSQR